MGLPPHTSFRDLNDYAQMNAAMNQCQGPALGNRSGLADNVPFTTRRPMPQTKIVAYTVTADPPKAKKVLLALPAPTPDVEVLK